MKSPFKKLLSFNSLQALLTYVQPLKEAVSCLVENMVKVSKTYCLAEVGAQLHIIGRMQLKTCTKSAS